MSTHIKMTAALRDRAGKGNARATRREGKVPAVIYGDNKPPIMVAIENIQVIKALHSGTFFTHLCDLEVNGQNHTVLARDVQLHPVKDSPTHVDFLRVSERTMITVEVPVHFFNEDKCADIKAGGVLTIIAHTIEVSCRADQIPDDIKIDLTNATMAASLKISDVKFPAGVKPVADADTPVASISEPSEEGEFVAPVSPADVPATAQKAPEAPAGAGSTKDKPANKDGKK